MIWNWLAIPSLVAFAMALALAGLVYFARPTGDANRALALMLLLEGTVCVSLAGGAYLMSAPEDVAALFAVGIVAILLKNAAYPHFLATLDTPLARPLRATPVRAAILVGGLASTAWYFLDRGDWLVRVVSPPWAAYDYIPGANFFLATKIIAAFFLLGLIFAVSAVRSATSEVTRQRARTFAVAFGTRDVLFATWALVMTTFTPTGAAFLPVFLSVNLIWILYLPLVAYGILKAQLFDIDLQLKRTLARSVVVGLIVAVFFLGTELATGFLERSWGTLVGLAAAAALALASRPLLRAGRAFADAVLPAAAGDESYILARKREVYRAAVEHALRDGAIEPREREFLAGLAAQLDIGGSAARAIETEASAARAA